MNATQFVEWFASLSLQSTVVIAAAYCLGKITGSDRTRCRLWTCCFVAILALLAIAACLPHLRLADPWSIVDTQTGIALLALQQFTGQALLVIWVGGMAVLLTGMVIRWWRASQYLQRCAKLGSEHQETLDDLRRT